MSRPCKGRLSALQPWFTSKDIVALFIVSQLTDDRTSFWRFSFSILDAVCFSYIH